MRNFSSLGLFLIMDECVLDGLTTGAVVLCSSHLLILTSGLFIPDFWSCWALSVVLFDPFCAVFSWSSVSFD